jgi:hypothetical protein
MKTLSQDADYGTDCYVNADVLFYVKLIIFYN